MKYVIFIMVFSCLLSCNEKSLEIYILPEKASSLLTDDSVKTWKIARRYNGKTRMNMGECFLGYRQRFRESGNVADNNSELRNCGPSLKAEWEITTTDKGHSYIKLTSDQIPALLNQAENYKLFKILFISRDSLTISFAHKQYGERRIITDYLVREDVEVLDRDFHY